MLDIIQLLFCWILTKNDQGQLYMMDVSHVLPIY